MHVKLMFPNEWIGAADLKGKDVTLTVSAVKEEGLRVNTGGTEDKWIVEFQEMAKRKKSDRKRWVLNKTNAMLIASIHGDDSDDWIGKKITLYPTTCQAFGKTVPCVRVRTDHDSSLVGKLESMAGGDDYDPETGEVRE